MQITDENIFEPSLNLEDIYINARQHKMLKGALLRSEEKIIANSDEVDNNEDTDVEEDNADTFEMTYDSGAYIIAGLQGNGKKTVVEAFAGTAGNCGYKVYLFSVSELIMDSPEDTFSEIRDFLDRLEKLLSEEEEKVFLILKDIWLFNDDSRAGKIFFSELWELVCNSSGHTIVAAAFDGAASELGEIFRGRCVHVIPLRKPDKEMRALFFDDFLYQFFNEETGVTAEYIAEITEDFTFGEMKALVDELVCMAKGDCLGDEGDDVASSVEEKDPATLIKKKDIDETVEDIVLSRYSGAAKGVRRSVFNYPKPKTVQAYAPAITQKENIVTAVQDKESSEDIKIPDFSGIENNNLDKTYVFSKDELEKSRVDTL